MRHMIKQDKFCGKLHLRSDMATAKNQNKLETRAIQSKAHLDTAWLNHVQPTGNTIPNTLLHLTTSTVRNPRLYLIPKHKVSL
jgi:hypothetical protein